MLLRECLSNPPNELAAVFELMKRRKLQVKGPFSVTRDDLEPGEVTRLKQPNRKLKPAEVDELVMLYQAGARLAALGRQFGMHEQTVRSQLQRRGVELRGKQALSKAKIRSVVRRYQAGESSVDLSRAFSVADSTIRNVLMREGVIMRPPSYHTDAWLKRQSSRPLSNDQNLWMALGLVT